MKTKFFIAIITFATLVACSSDDSQTGPQKSEQEIAVENLISKCQDFDAESIIQGLPGEWVIELAFYYDEDWQKIIKCIYDGKYGLFCSRIFNLDGTAECFLAWSTDIKNGASAHCNWSYDAENKEIITVDVEGNPYHMKVLGFNGEHLVLDCIIKEVSHTKEEIFNCRQIFRRKTDE